LHDLLNFLYWKFEMSSLLDPLMGPSKDLGLRNQLMKKKPKKKKHEIEYLI